MIENRFDEIIPLSHINRPGIKCDKILAFGFHYTANDREGATDTANAKYFGRPFIKKLNAKGALEYWEADGKRKFAYGSTNKVIDCNSVTTVIPVGEMSYHAGDHQLSRTNGYDGQTKMAKEVFGYRQNRLCVTYEMCNNKDWADVVSNTIEEVVSDLIALNLTPDQVLFVRHFDLTGKICPKPFVDNEGMWVNFKTRIKMEYAKRTRVKEEEDTLALDLKKIEEIKKELIVAKEESIAMCIESVTELFDAVMASVDKLAEPEKPKAEISKPVLKILYTTTNLNLRKTPGATTPESVIFVLPQGTAVEAVEQANGWMKVIANKEIGWVSSAYLVDKKL